MIQHRIRRRAAVFLLCGAALVAGCRQADTAPNQAAPSPQGNGTSAEQQSPSSKPSGSNGSSSKSAYMSLAAEPASLSLSPGAKKQLTIAGVKKDQSKQQLAGDKAVTFASSAVDIVSVSAEGTLSASSKAKSGQTAVVTVQYEGLKKEVAVTVKTSLDDTIATIAGVPTVTNTDAIDVVVNKKRSLPSTYTPKLVEPNVPFSFKEKSEKRMMRPEAAQALEQLFAAAKKDGIQLYGVSAYRSFATQKSLYNTYVKKQGEKEASQYSALPGMSEHQTGLAIDVDDGDPKCSVENCFADTKAAKWLVEHAAESGFIIRYLKGKESITGYQYEPWHIRFVGVDIAKEVAKQGVTLEEYFQDAIAAGAGVSAGAASSAAPTSKTEKK